MKTLFEAVVLRFVPDEGAGEFLNVGLAMRTEHGEFFKAELLERWKRVSDAFPSAHVPTVKTSFRRVRDALGRLETAELNLPHTAGLADELRRLVPSPDGYLKWSETVEGETDDPRETFARLMHRYVEQHLQERPERQSRTDDDVKASFAHALARRGALSAKLTPRKLVASGLERFEVEVQHSWKNGRWNCIQPVSLDLSTAHHITQKALQIGGGVQVVAPSKQDAHLVLLVGLPPDTRPEVYEAAQQSIRVVRRLVGENDAEVVFEADSELLLDRIEADLAAH